MLKKVFSLAVVFLILLGMIACSHTPAFDTPVRDNSSSEFSNPTEPNALIGNTYIGRWRIGEYGFAIVVLRFYEDQTVHIVDCGGGRDIDPVESYYATYSLTGNAMTIRFGSDEYAGVVLNDGEKFTIGSERFDLSDPNNLDEKILAEFNEN